MNRVRGFLLLAVASVLLLLPAHCSSKEEMGKETGMVALKFNIWGTAVEERIWKKIIDTFQKQHPDINIKFELVPGWDAYWSKILTSVASGTGPDVFYMYSGYIPAYAERDILLDLSSYLAQDDEIAVNDFYPLALDCCKYKGAIYMLPMEAQTYVLYYNKGIFKRAGLGCPDASWTWDKLLETARKLTQDFDGDGRIDQFGISDYHMWSAIYQNGGRVFNLDMAPVACDITNPLTVEAIEFCTDLSVKYHVAPSLVGAQNIGMEIEQLFMAGKVAICCSGRWFVAPFKKITGFEWDVAPLPRGKTQAVAVHASGPVVYRGSRHLKEAYQFARFITGPEAQKMYVDLGICVPSRRPVAESPEFLDCKPPENNRAFVEQLKYARPYETVPQIEQVEHIMEEELDLARLGKRTVKESCEAIKKRVDAIIRK